MTSNAPHSANETLVRRLFLDGFSKNDPDVLRAVLSEDFALSSAGAIADDDVNKTSGRDTLIAGMHHNHRSFADWRFEIDHLMGAGDHVAARWTATGTHVGSFMGEPPTGKPVTLQGNSLYRIADGQIVADWVFANQADFAAQLGIGAPPAPGPGEALVRAFWDDVINAHDPDAADKLMAPTYRQHAAGIAQGPEGFKTFLRDVLGDSLGMKAEVLRVIDTGEMVISTTRITFSVPPEGWQPSQVIIDVFRTDGTHLLEHWDMPAG